MEKFLDQGNEYQERGGKHLPELAVAAVTGFGCRNWLSYAAYAAMAELPTTECTLNQYRQHG